MSSRAYLHIGASKTGTTYLQGVLDANRDELSRQGVLFPAPLIDHFRFMRHVLGRQGGAPAPKAADAAFERILERSHAHDGVLLVSNELLAAADDTQLRRVAASLAPAELHVVYTVRDLARTLAAEWQQAVKGGSAIPLDTFASSVAETFGQTPQSMPSVVGESQVVEKFTVLHDVPAVLARWAAVVEPAHIHVVTVPPAGGDPAVLWERFGAATAIDPTAGSRPPRRRNESLGAAEVETLRRVNRELAAGTGYDFVRSEWVRHRFVLPVLMPRPVTARIAIRDTHHAWAVERAQQIVAALRGSGYDVVGDLSDLVPAPEPREGVHPGDVPEETLSAVATDWVATLLMRARGNDRGRSRASRADA